MRNTFVIALEMFDPRGRISRKGLVVVAAVLLLLQFAVAALLLGGSADASSPGALVSAILFYWVAFTGCAKRLHDVGRSAWWILGALGLWFLGTVLITVLAMLIFGADVFAGVSHAFQAHGFGGLNVPALALLVAISAPVLAGTIWLHVAVGEMGNNRFGPAPDVTGFSGPHASRFRSSTASA